MSWLDRFLAYFLPPPPEIGPDEDVVFVDVRTRFEFEGDRVKDARHIPYDQMPARWKELRDVKDKRILLYCRSGSRSRAALQVLQANGFEKAENAGGIGGLRRAGVTIVRPESLVGGARVVHIARG
jgi:phage shock protein E